MRTLKASSMKRRFSSRLPKRISAPRSGTATRLICGSAMAPEGRRRGREAGIHAKSLAHGFGTNFAWFAEEVSMPVRVTWIGKPPEDREAWEDILNAEYGN